jgi:hypothetical protein
MRGRPRARLIRTGSVGDVSVSSAIDSSLTSANCNSVSSSFGTMSVELVRVFRRDSDGVSGLLKILESKLGVVSGESLADDMEGCGEELVLKRACAPGGEWPKETVEIIQSSNKDFSYWKRRAFDIWRYHQSTNSSKRRNDVELAQSVAQCDTLGSACTVYLQLNSTCDKVGRWMRHATLLPTTLVLQSQEIGRMVVKTRAIARMVA